MVTMTSDHAGMARELQHLETEMRHVLARADDARDTRDYVRWLVNMSKEWLKKHPHKAPWEK
jgi:hypothetical protein